MARVVWAPAEGGGGGGVFPAAVSARGCPGDARRPPLRCGFERRAAPGRRGPLRKPSMARGAVGFTNGIFSDAIFAVVVAMETMFTQHLSWSGTFS